MAHRCIGMPSIGECPKTRAMAEAGFLIPKRRLADGPSFAPGPHLLTAIGTGMPDAWERANRLDPSDPSDQKRDRNGDGYTNLEEYLNSLVE